MLRTPHHLPAPGPDARAHGERVLARVVDAARAAGGSLDFAAFMEIALYAPGLGYYSAGAGKLGEAGDFVTAPEISPLFGECVAWQCAEILTAIGGGEVLEVGAGTGALAASVVATLERVGAPFAGYRVLERSADLRARQASCLAAAGVAHRVRWVDGLPVSGFRGVVLANELLDALPAHRLVVRDGGFEEWRVAPAPGGLEWVRGAAPPGLASRARALCAELPAPLPDGYCFEMAPVREAWVGTAGGGLEAGTLLLVDYGHPRAEYYHPQRVDGTLACHYRHRLHHDPLVLVGLQDLSVHVEFTAVAEAAVAAGLAVSGFTSQAEFLLALGLLDGLAGVEPGTPRYVELTTQVKRLTLPGEMGSLVKVMVLSRGVDCPLTGFSGRDLRGRL